MSNFLNSYRFGSTQILSDLEFAFSFKKRVATATNSLRIRRDNDDAETDLILEDSGEVDINSSVSAGGTLATWIGSNNGYMVTHYDQTGNGFDMTQATKTAQARIVTAGVWNGYIDYTVGNCVYLSSSGVNLSSGCVYLKVDRITNDTLYYLSQAVSSSSSILGMGTSFSSPNNKMRLMDFQGGGTDSNLGDETIPSGVNKLMFQGDGVSYKMRLNSTNQTITGTDSGTWYSFYFGAGRSTLR